MAAVSPKSSLAVHFWVKVIARTYSLDWQAEMTPATKGSSLNFLSSVLYKCHTIEQWCHINYRRVTVICIKEFAGLIQSHTGTSQFPMWDTPSERLHGSCCHQNKYAVQGDEYSHHADALQAHLIEGISYSAHRALQAVSLKLEQ